MSRVLFLVVAICGCVGGPQPEPPTAQPDDDTAGRGQDASAGAAADSGLDSDPSSPPPDASFADAGAQAPDFGETGEFSGARDLDTPTNGLGSIVDRTFGPGFIKPIVGPGGVTGPDAGADADAATTD